MNKNTKIILGILIGIIIICLCTCLGGWLALRITGKVIEEKAVLDSPEEAETFAKSMIDYELPQGFKEEMAFNMLFMKMVMISKGGAAANDPSQTVIMIAEMPIDGEIDAEEMRLQLQLKMKQAMRRQDWDMELVDEKETIIREEEVSLLIYEGVDENGGVVRQVISSLFEGNNGRIMLWIAGSASEWNQTEIDNFINSIR